MAFHNYQDAHGKLPPAVVYGKSGQPLYSWRVVILPFIEQQELYREFHLDEPWDSPHNITLLERMPGTYLPPYYKRSRVRPHHTVMHVFVGKGAAFEDGKELSLAEDFPDGSSRTLLVVEAGDPVPWTKPEDIAFDPDGPLPPLPGLFRDSIRVALMDGSMRNVSRTMSEATLKAAITRNGGEELGVDW